VARAAAAPPAAVTASARAVWCGVLTWHLQLGQVTVR
jgi:hypothetical protein